MDEQSKDLAQITDPDHNLNLTPGTTGTAPVVNPSETKTPGKTVPLKEHGLSAADAGSNTALGRPIARPRRPAPRKRANPWGWIFIILLAVAAGAGTFFYVRSTQTNPAFQGQTTPATTRTPVSIAVSANGQIQANADLGITFGSSGTVTKLFHKLGDTVKVGDPLAQLDDSDLQLSVKSAQASYAQALASYKKATDGATQKDLEVAQAQVDAANANLSTTINGSFTAQDIASANAAINSAAAKLQQDRQGGQPYDIAAAQSSISSAQASLASAQAKLAKDQAGPDNATIVQAQTTVATSQASVEQAQATYDRTLSQLKLSITNAEVNRDQLLNALKTAQEKYNTIYANNRNADGTLKTNITQASIDSETGAYRAIQDAQGNYNKADIALNDARAQLETQSRSMQSQIDSAKAQLENAKVQLQKIQQGPTSADIAADQAAVAQAQASLDSAHKTQAALTPTDSQIASDEASLASAQASLSKLRGGTPEQVAASEASVRQAQATLKDLQGGPKPNDIAISKAQLDVAQTSLDRAKTAAANSLIKSPIAGTIVQAPLTEGQVASAASVVYQIVDLSTLHVDVNVAENDISKIKLDMPVAVNLDGIPSRSFSGKVSFVSSKSTVSSNVVSYLATVTLDNTGTNSLLEVYQAEFAKIIPTGGQRGQGQGNAAGGLPAGGNFRLPAGASAQFAAATGICGYSIASLFNRGGNQAQDQTTPKVGMTANVTFCLSLKGGVLSVPNRALKSKTENGQRINYVQVLVDKDTNKIEDRPVLLGLAGDNNTEITGGSLKDGDLIVLSTTRTTAASTTGGGGANPFGGGGGGAGPGGGR